MAATSVITERSLSIVRTSFSVPQTTVPRRVRDHSELQGPVEDEELVGAEACMHLERE